MSVVKTFFPKKNTLVSNLKGQLEASKLLRYKHGYTQCVTKVRNSQRKLEMVNESPY